MSFSPLPEIFLEDLRNARGAVVDLGCGDGRFSAEMERCGVSPLKVDRRRPSNGSVADIVADVQCLPCGHRSVSVLVAANLLRHLWPFDNGQAVPQHWLDCLRDDGCLYIFEDELDDHRPAAKNYRKLQKFLARVDPGRGHLMRMRDYRAIAGGPRWRLGEADNVLRPKRDAVLRLLTGGGVEAGSDVARLCTAIAEEGISYGKFWWARWGGEARR